jgi:hypothetical protein
MKLKALLAAGAFCLAGSTFLAAKSRDFTIDRPAMCGNVQLAPGSYRVTTRANGIEITDLNHFVDKKPITVAATKQAGDTKFDHTAVVTTDENGTNRITEIDLSHSTTKIELQ